MSSKTKVEYNNFNAFIKIFFIQIKAVNKKVNKFIILVWQKVVEIYKVAYVEIVLDFDFNNGPILEVDTLVSLTIRSNS